MQSRLLSVTTRKDGNIENKDGRVKNKDGCKARCPVALVKLGKAVSDMSAKVEFGHSKPSVQACITEGRTCQGTERKPSSKGHKPGTTGRVASEETERKRWSKGHPQYSPSGGHGGKDMSGIEQKRQSRGCSPTGGCRGIWQDTERIQHSEGLTTRRLQREGCTMTQKESAHMLCSMGNFSFLLTLTNPFPSHDCLLDTSPDHFLAYLTAFLSSWERQLITRIVVLISAMFSSPAHN